LWKINIITHLKPGLKYANFLNTLPVGAIQVLFCRTNNICNPDV